MKKLLCLLLALCFVFALCACGGETNTEDPSEVETTQNKATEEQTNGTTDDVTVDDGKVEYTVKVVDEAGNPVAAVEVIQVCDENNSCSVIFMKDGQGSMRLAEAEYHATLMKGLPEGYEYTTEETEFSFDGDYTCTITLKAVQ